MKIFSDFLLEAIEQSNLNLDKIIQDLDKSIFKPYTIQTKINGNRLEIVGNLRRTYNRQTFKKQQNIAEYIDEKYLRKDLPWSIHILESLEDQLLKYNKNLKFTSIDSEEQQIVQVTDFDTVNSCFVFKDNIILNGKIFGSIRVFQENDEYRTNDNGKGHTTVQTKDRLQVMINVK